MKVKSVNITSKSELLNVLKTLKLFNSTNNRLLGFQYSFLLKNQKLPFINKADFKKIAKDLLCDLSFKENITECISYNRQWRHFEANFNNDKGVDQINVLVNMLRKGVSDRRLLLVSWNCRDIKSCSLVHCLFQFYIANDRLSCKLYQSSANLSDVFQYDSGKAALLTYMLCHVTGLKPGTLTHSFGELQCDIDILSSEEISNFGNVQVNFSGNCKEIEDFSFDHFSVKDATNSDTKTLSIFDWIYIFDDRIVRHEEFQYIDIVKNIIENGTKLSDRTGVGTMSIFGPQMIFSLHNNTLPLLTTKLVFYRGIIEELLWFLRGSTDGNELAKRNVNIWKANGSKKFLADIGLGHREEGDLGPIYGFQWRHFGANYVDMFTDYSCEGVDQIANLIKSIMETPEHKNHVVMSWNPKDLPLMALPPCHCLMQFFVEGRQLSCKLYQRSADMGLGVPFNIASYSILIHMIAHITGLEPGYFIHTLGDAHVYLNHIKALNEQMVREPREFPSLKFRRKVEKIEDFKIQDFILENYNPHPKIVMEMAV